MVLVPTYKGTPAAIQLVVPWATHDAPAEVCHVTREMPEPEAATPPSVRVAPETVDVSGAGVRMATDSGTLELEGEAEDAAA